VGEWGGERGGIRFSNPGHLGRGREREREGSGRGRRGTRAGVVDVALGRRGRGRGGGFGAAARAGDRREEGDGPDRWAPPVGDPERGGSGAAWLPGWASACGRPNREGEGGKEKWADGPFDKKEEKREEKEKEKGKRIFPGIKYCLLNFNWLKLFLEL
jgi:hypothetical protein